MNANNITDNPNIYFTFEDSNLWVPPLATTKIPYANSTFLVFTLHLTYTQPPAVKTSILVKEYSYFKGLNYRNLVKFNELVYYSVLDVLFNGLGTQTHTPVSFINSMVYSVCLVTSTKNWNPEKFSHLIYCKINIYCSYNKFKMYKDLTIY